MKRFTLVLAFGLGYLISVAQTPEAYFTFNGNAQDMSGNGHHGTVNGATLTTDRFGNPNSAYFFDGIDDYIDIANPLGLQATNYTFSLWVKPASNPIGTAQCAVSVGGNSGDQFISNINAGGDIGLNISGYQMPSGTFDLVSGQVPSIGVWYYVVGIRSNAYSLLYVNGILVDSVAFSPALTPKYGQNFANIGRRTYNQFQYFHGSIDDLKIYTEATVPENALVSPYRSCWEIHEANPLANDGNYTIDPDGPGGMNAFSCSCDMTTDGGGWTLVSNYNHLSGTNPATQYRNTDLPLLGSSILGVDESATSFWGNATNSLMNQIPFDTLRWFGTSSQAGKVTHFKSGHLGAWNMAKTGNGDYSGMNSSKIVYPDNTSVNMNCNGTSGVLGNNWANLMQCFGIDIWSVGIQSSGACTPFPGWPNIWQWSIDASYCDNNHPNSLHRIWVKGPNPCNMYTSLPSSTVLTSNTICVDGNWKHISNPANGNQIIASIDDNDLALGTITGSIYLEPGNTGLYNGQNFLKRHYVISAQNNPVGIKRIRLYFTSTELNDLMSVDGSINSVADLKVTKYSGPTADGIYNPADATSVILIPSSSITTGMIYGVYFLEFDVDGFSEFWIHGGSNAPLPVHIKSFNGKVCETQSCLTWEVANEQHVSRYNVERSANGIHFETIGSIYDVKNIEETHGYSYTDSAPLFNSNYYRLKSIDIDGQSTQTHVVKINHSLVGDVMVYPSSSPQGEFTIRSQYPIDAYQVYNTTGQLVSEVKSNLKISLTSLPSDVYIVRIKIGNEHVTKRIVKE